MKALLLSGFILSAITGPSWASDELIKSCSTEMRLEETRILSKTDIVRRNGKLLALTEQSGQIISQDAQISTHAVQALIPHHHVDDINPNPSVEAAIQALNFGEKLISHALTMTSSEEMKAAGMDAGLDLKKVRSVTVYQLVGEPGEMGIVAILEARDAKGKNLGSFMGGFLVSPCK